MIQHFFAGQVPLFKSNSRGGNYGLNIMIAFHPTLR